MSYNYQIQPYTENRTFWDVADLNMRQKMGLALHFSCSRQLTQSIFLQYIFQSASLNSWGEEHTMSTFHTDTGLKNEREPDFVWASYKEP